MATNFVSRMTRGKYIGLFILYTIIFGGLLWLTIADIHQLNHKIIFAIFAVEFFGYITYTWIALARIEDAGQPDWLKGVACIPLINFIVFVYLFLPASRR